MKMKAIKYFYFFIFCIILGISILACQSEEETVQIPPNILLLLTDDMGYGDVSLAGNAHISTAHLDALANESVNFKYFYVSPVCAPTRASLLTGCYHQRVGVRSVTNGFETLDSEAITLAEILQKNNYKTGIFGKWHLGEYYPSLPNAQGFDEYLGFRTGHTNEYDNAILEHNGKPQKTDGYITDVLTHEAIEFMETSGNEDQPFFCYLAYNAPHTPLIIDSTYYRKYLEKGLDERTARIYGMIENIDDNIGKLMTFLSEQMLSQNTIIIFMSDNGPISGWKVPQEKMRYNAGLRDQKFSIYEGGIRTQAYWKWEGQWPSRIVDHTLAAHIDVMPTVLSLLNIPVS